MSNPYETLNEIVEWLYGAIVAVEDKMEFLNKTNRHEDRRVVSELHGTKKAYIEVLEKIEAKMERRELNYVRK